MKDMQVSSRQVGDKLTRVQSTAASDKLRYIYTENWYQCYYRLFCTHFCHIHVSL